MSERSSALGKIPLAFAAVHLVLAVVAALDANWIRAGLQLLLTFVWGGWYYWFNVRSRAAASGRSDTPDWGDS